ncbi:MAG: LysR substrate-binding domain-containing protein, partial [Crocinitomicaceae bacterium]|nr:LysR substrate-binding domain-containing protein [Crocinitomicaceae bacterium]
IDFVYMVSFQQLQYILALAEERHFERASERCFVTQPTLSMQLKKAEDLLGNKIFDRSRSPVELTSFGEQIIPVFRNVWEEYDRIKETVEKEEGTYKESIVIGVIPTIAGYLLPDLFSKWKELLPNIQMTILELTTANVLKALEEKQIDLGIIAGPESDSRLKITPLYQEEIKVYIPSYPKDELSTNELLDYNPWLLTSGNCLRTQMIHFCNLGKSKKDDWDYQGGNVELLQRMVCKHGGYTLVPEHYISEPEEGYKTIRSEEGEVPARAIVGLSRSRSSKWKTLEVFLRSIQLEYGGNNKNDLKILDWK